MRLRSINLHQNRQGPRHVATSRYLWRPHKVSQRCCLKQRHNSRRARHPHHRRQLHYSVLRLDGPEDHRQLSCTMVYGTDFDGEAGEGFAYQTVSTGTDCDTTASCQTIRAAVGECVDRLHEARAVRGCCRNNYGGPWSGQLRLRAEADGWPLADC